MHTTSDNDLRALVKIVVAYHKPACLPPKGNVYIPLHLGRDADPLVKKEGPGAKEELEWLYTNMHGDNTGDNISSMNSKINEVTGIYWAWKNYRQLGDPEYIGFMHYQRYLAFSPALTRPHKGKTIFRKQLTQEVINDYGLDDDSIICRLRSEQPDIVVRQAHYLSCFTKAQNNIEHYKSAPDHCLDLLLHAFDFVEKTSPEFKSSIESYKSSDFGYFCNIFVFKKDIFFKYCEWLFKIVFELEKTIDYAALSLYGYRKLGYVVERLTDIYIRYLIATNHKTLELPLVKITDTGVTYASFEPAFEKNNIAVCFASDSKYIPYLCVSITSLLKHCSSENNYDIIILSNNIDEQSKQILVSLFCQRKNIALRFYEVSKMFANKNFFCRAYLTETTYARIFISEIFNKYEKVVYLDSDVIVLDDIASLYSENINNYLLGVVLEYNIGVKLNANIGGERIDYFEQIVGVKDPINNYFNAGVLIFNIKEFTANNLTQKLLDKATKNKFVFADQDVFNSVCYGKVKFLDTAWNVFNESSIRKGWMDKMPLRYYRKYMLDRKKPKIIHYATPYKPWYNPKEDLSSVWWEYARLTPYYEMLIDDLAARIARKAAKTKYFYFPMNFLKHPMVKKIKHFFPGKTSLLLIGISGFFSSQIFSL